MRATPFSLWMKKKLETASKRDVQVEVDGVSGAMVTSNTKDGYRSRMGEQCEFIYFFDVFEKGMYVAWCHMTVQSHLISPSPFLAPFFCIVI